MHAGFPFFGFSDEDLVRKFEEAPRNDSDIPGQDSNIFEKKDGEERGRGCDLKKQEVKRRYRGTNSEKCSFSLWFG